jgi:phosphopantothenoylcysteine decarboxylase/phosphopantothenate--cysteine ligase
MKLIIGVCGSISAYKAYDISRGLVKAGHEVKVIMTTGAQNFIKPETFKYLGVTEVYEAGDDFNKAKQLSSVLHIDLKNWMDKLVIVPASANTLAKLANGFCDDLLSSVFLCASEKESIIFPAMNTQMYLSPITQKNLNTIKLNKLCFIHAPATGLLACGDNGVGKLPETDDILEFIQTYTTNDTGREILISTGATVAPLDSVRYLTNPASGKTGYELAKSYLKEGCKVTLVYGKLSDFNTNSLKEHPRLKLLSVETTEDMYKAVKENFESSDVFISSAAVSDIEFKTQEEKIKKDKFGTKISFTWAKDVLAEMIKKKKHQKIVSFAAESSEDHVIFQNKWERKPVDLMVGNVVHNGFNGQPQGFGQNKNQYFFIKNGSVSDKQELTKAQLSQFIYNYTENDK